MTASLFPVAPTAEAALHTPDGFAARESEAARLAGADVAFASETVGPAFTTREAAEAAYGDRLGAGAAWCALRPVASEGGASQPARPLRTGGSRWPAPEAAPPALWRLQVSWWRSGVEEPDVAPLAPARRARREAAGAALDGRALGRLAVQPLRAVRPQQPLDIGLFEVRAPERPDELIPDE